MQQSDVNWWGTKCNSVTHREINGHFTDDIVECICLNENIILLSQVVLKFLVSGPIGEYLIVGSAKGWYFILYKLLPKSILTQFTDTYMHCPALMR